MIRSPKKPEICGCRPASMAARLPFWRAPAGQKKGFMHSLEGTIAAMILLFYTIQLFESMSVQTLEWTQAAAKQESQEYLLALKNSAYKGLLFSGGTEEFLGITRHFLGEGKGYSVKATGIPKTFFEVGVMANATVNVAGTINTTQCPVKTEYACYNSSFKGIKYVLVDYDGGRPNGKEDYDALYFDFDSSGTYNISEGPFSETNTLFIGGAYWAVGKIINYTGNVSFWSADRLVGIKSMLNDFSINGRTTNISVRGASFEYGFDEFDAIILPGKINLTQYRSQIMPYLQGGGGIVALRNITSPADIGPGEREILGIFWVSNGTTDVDNSGTLADMPPGREAYTARKYFLFAGMFAGTPKTDTSGYDTTGIPNRDTARVGNVSLRRQTYAVLATKSGSSGYDRIRIDFNSPRDNFTDETALSSGSSVVIGGNNYTVKEIRADGTGAALTGKPEYSFSNFLNPGTKVYPVTKSGEYIFATAKSSEYNITSRALSSQTLTSPSACAGGEATLPAGTHKCGSFSAGAAYSFAITNVSQNYTLLNIDLNYDGSYNGAGEGPYPTGSLISFGPESYRAFVDPLGTTTIWELEGRWSVPYGVMNYVGAGAAAWMPDNLASRDEWALFEAALAAAGRNDIQIGRGSSTGKWIDTKAVFFESNETYQPYEVSIRMWY